LKTTSDRSWPIAAAKVVVAVTLAAVLYVAHAAFIPVFLALLLSLVLSGPVEMLHRRRVPRALSAAVIVMIALSLMAGVTASLWTPAQEWYAKAPHTLATIKAKVGPVAKAMHRLDDLLHNASEIASPSGEAPAAAAPPPAAPPTKSAPALLWDAGIPAIAAAVTFVIVTLFLLAGGPPMLARMTAAFVSDLKASHALALIEKVRVEVGHFYLTTTLINVGLGAITGVAMWAWGMPTPYLWGALAAIVNYIPYAGAASTLIVVTLVAAMSFDTLGQVVGVASTYLLVATIEGQVVQPLLVGRRLEVNPLLIFLGLWFGGLFWGIAGIILATPALVALKVVAENSASGKSLTEFLGPNGQTPERGTALYRLVRKSKRPNQLRDESFAVPDSARVAPSSRR
jgi:predicted PurR-regulated permease PerM